jgi:fibronectin-binding autotransporter adhesin
MKRFCVSAAAIAIAGLAASPLWAQSETWAVNAAGNWSNVDNWSGSSAYASGADQTANFSALSGNTVVTDDLATNTIGYMVFGTGAATLSPQTAGYTLTLQTTVPGTTPTITVGGNTTTMTVALAGSQGFVLNGGGELNFTSVATILPTGNVAINASTLQFTGSLSTATDFVLNNGATLNLGSGNTNIGSVLPSSAIYVSSAGNSTDTLGGTGFYDGSTKNQMQCTLTGNGNVNWNLSALNIVNGNLWQSYGGIVNWGSNVNGFRASSGAITMNAQFADINLGTATASLSDKSTATMYVGALAGGPGTSLQSSVTMIEGMANLSTSWAGSTASPFTKIGIGTLTVAPTSAWTTTSVAANGGTLQLNYANSPNGVLASSSTTTFTGGTLYLLGNTSGASLQTLRNVTVNSGDGQIVANANGGSGTTLNMGTITDTAVGGCLNLNAMPGTVAITTTSGTQADGTYGGRLTYTDSNGNTDFVTAVTSVGSTSTLGRYTGYSAFTGSGDSLTTDYALVGNGALGLSDTVNLLKISTSGPGQSLSGAFTLTLSGALLFTGSNNYSINTTGLNSMFFTSGGSANADILIHNYGTGSLTIAAKMNNNNGSATLTLDGPGTTVLTNTGNSYVGATYVNGATLSTSSALVLGGTSNSSALELFGGTFQATQSFSLNNGTTNHSVTIGGGGGTFDVTPGNTLTVAGTVANVSTSNVGPLVKVDSGALVLANGANTYGGATIIDGGVLSVNVLANGLALSSVGTSSAAAPALVLNGGVLQYTGAGASTDRSFVLTNNGGGIDASGSGPLVFSTTSNVMLVPSPIVTTGPLAGSGPRLFSLTGTNTGLNNFAGQIVDGTGGATSLNKSGPGQWVLSNVNTYSGGTTVSSGTLSLASAFSTNNIASSTLINVAAGSVLNTGGLANATLALAANQTLTGAGSVTGSLTAPALSTINPGTVTSGNAGSGALAISGGLSLFSNSTVNFGLNGASGTANLVSVGGALALPASGAPVNVNLYAPNTSSQFFPGSGTTTYDLFQYGSLTGSLSELSVANGVGAYSYSFGTVAIGGADYVQLSTTLVNIVATWSNTGAGNWSNPSNWSGGVPQVPGDSAIFSSAITSSATVTLDHTESVGSVTFSNTNSYTISGTNTLTLSSPSGASLSDNLGSHTIAVPLDLAVNTGASVANGGVLTISGRLSGGGALTKNGNGTLVLANSNGYGPSAGSVGTTLNAGVLRVGNNAALSTGDVSVAGNSTLQAGANGLVLNNNLIVASGITATVDTQGNTLTLAGLVSESAPSGSLAVIGAGTLVLANSNTYTGTTTITSATLQLDNGGSTGYVGGPILNNGALALDRGDTGLVLSSIISGTGSLSQIGAGISTLNAANTFNGNTTISAGTLQLANSLGLQNSTLVLNNPAGTLGFGTLTAATLDGLSGSASLAITNVNGAAVALTVGNNGASSTYSGGLGGLGSLTVVGGSTFTLEGSSSYSGATLANAGALVIGPNGVVSTTTADTSNVGTIAVTGGVLTSSSLSTIGTTNGNGGAFTMSSGTASFNGGITTPRGVDGQLISIAGGNFSALSINLLRTSGSLGGPSAVGVPPTIPTGSGLYISGGTATIGPLTIGSGDSSATARIDGGVVNATGEVLIGDETNTRWNYMQVNGGSFTSTDTVNGIIIGQCGGTGGTETIQSELYLTGGTTSAQIINFGTAADTTGGTANLALRGGTLYVGSGGLVQPNTSGLVSNILLGSGVLGATSSWSTTMNISLVGNATTGATVQAADPFGNPQNIALNGVLSGSGALTKTGGGLLTLSNNNTYTGNTTVSAGTLALTNNIPSSPLITVASGAVLDVSGLGGATLGQATPQTLTGAGAVNGSLTVSAPSAINPGTVTAGLAGSGTLTIAGDLSLLDGSSVNFGLSNSNGTANVVNVGGTLNLPSSTPAVNINLYVPNTSTPFVPANGAVYDLFQYGALNGSLSELTVANASGLFTYSFGTVAVGAADYVQLSITQGSIWTKNGSGNWSSPGNWSAAVPQNPGDTAIFSSAITSPATITLDQPESAGSVAFGNTNSYIISGTNTLTLSSTSGGALLSVALGSHTIAVPLNLAVNTEASVANGGVLTLSGQISGPGTLTTSDGNGTLVLSNSNGYGPAAGSVGTTLNAGTVLVSNNASLSTGDVSVAGNANVQAGANVLVLANNFIIGPGATATFDTQGNTLTLPGLISESSPPGSLAVIGTGTLILTNGNTYSGTTTITSATLQLDNGGSNGSVNGPIVNNGALVLDRGDTNLALSNVISGSGSLTQIGSGMSTLNAANTFGGTTTISAGTLQLGNSLALQNSTLNYNNQGGVLSFGGLGAATLGGLSGSQGLPLLNAFGGGVALTVGSNNLSTTYSGALSDAGAGGSLTKAGSGTLTLTGSNSYTGTTSVTAGILTLPPGGSINSQGAVAISGNAIFSVAGGTLTAPSGSISTNPGDFSISSGIASFSGALNANQNGDSFWEISATGGSLSAASMTLGRGGITTQVNGPLVQPSIYGLYVNGGNVNVAGTIFEGNSSSYDSSVSIRIDSGILSVGGAVQVSDATAGRWSVLDVNGGTLSVADTTNGVVLANQNGADSSLVVDGSAAVAMVGAITLGQGVTSGSGVVSLTAGALYVGAGGIVQSGGGSFVSSILLGGGTLGATGPWSSSLPMSLTGNVTVQAGDPFGNPQSIALSGNLSGNGALTLGGNGTGELVLSGSNTYTGDTIVDSGSLIVESPDSLPAGSNLLVGLGASSIFAPVAGASLAASQAVPEPGTLALLLAAFWSAAACCRFSKRRAAA